MSRRRAPTAKRRPISRVRSFTETSIVFMMLMPPTRSDMEAIESSRRLKALAELSWLEKTSAEVKMLKSFGESLLNRCLWRNRSSTRCFASSAPRRTSLQGSRSPDDVPDAFLRPYVNLSI